jgi:hypothetical protein
VADGDPFYSPKFVPPRRQPTPGELLWEFRKDHVTWSCELRFHGESYGWEAQILRDGDLFAAHGAFMTRAAAMQWADLEKNAIEKDRE